MAAIDKLEKKFKSRAEQDRRILEDPPTSPQTPGLEEQDIAPHIEVQKPEAPLASLEKVDNTCASEAESTAIPKNEVVSRPLPPPEPVADKKLNFEIIELARKGEKIRAIKLFREMHGSSLREAKDAIDSIGVQNIEVSRRLLSGSTSDPDDGAGQESGSGETRCRHPRHEDVVEKVRRGQRIEAVKLYRQFYGVDLGQARKAINLIADGHDPDAFRPLHKTPAPQAAILTSELTDPELSRYLEQRQTIQAIKRYRELTGVGLAEAKSVIDELTRKMP
jgi:ribosomal protein L7/L12